MERRQVGVVKELFRYPVKSMLGERLSELDIGEHGVIGDRAYTLREAGSGRVVSAKKWANMLDFRTRYDAQPTPGTLAPLRIMLPDGRTISAQALDASTVLSSVLGRPVILERAQPNQHTRAEIDPLTIFGEVGVENVKPGMTAATMPDSFALPRGTFFDSALIHVLASGTLSHMRHLIGEDAQLDARRFRPNIVVETAAGTEGFVEDGWLAGTLEIGGCVKLVDLRPALRCVMTTHRQAELARDPRILRAAAQHHAANLGVFGAIGAPGKVRVGDSIVLGK